MRASRNGMSDTTEQQVLDASALTAEKDAVSPPPFCLGYEQVRWISKVDVRRRSQACRCEFTGDRVGCAAYLRIRIEVLRRMPEERPSHGVLTDPLGERPVHDAH